MKKLFAFILFATAIGCTHAKNSEDNKSVVQGMDMDSSALNEAYRGQVDSTYKPEVKKPQPNIQNIPAFKLYTTDNKNFTHADLNPNKPVMFIYFSPDCSHCTKFLHELEPDFKKLNNMQVIFATWIKFEAILPFYKEFGLKNYPNFVVGTEGNDLLIQQYFQIKETPYIAVYNNKGKLVKTFDKVPKVDELLKSTKGL